jgi:hypothetical protein
MERGENMQKSSIFRVDFDGCICFSKETSKPKKDFSEISVDFSPPSPSDIRRRFSL